MGWLVAAECTDVPKFIVAVVAGIVLLKSDVMCYAYACVYVCKCSIQCPLVNARLRHNLIVLCKLGCFAA